VASIWFSLYSTIFTNMMNRIINNSRNERVTQQACDTNLQMFDVWTLRHTAHIEAIVQFMPHSAQKVRCDGLHSRGNSVLQIRYAHGLWWHKHFVLQVNSNERNSVWRTSILGERFKPKTSADMTKEYCPINSEFRFLVGHMLKSLMFPKF